MRRRGGGVAWHHGGGRRGGGACGERGCSLRTAVVGFPVALIAPACLLACACLFVCLCLRVGRAWFPGWAPRAHAVCGAALFPTSAERDTPRRPVSRVCAPFLAAPCRGDPPHLQRVPPGPARAPPQCGPRTARPPFLGRCGARGGAAGLVTLRARFGVFAVCSGCLLGVPPWPGGQGCSLRVHPAAAQFCRCQWRGAALCSLTGPCGMGLSRPSILALLCALWGRAVTPCWRRALGAVCGGCVGRPSWRHCPMVYCACSCFGFLARALSFLGVCGLPPPARAAARDGGEPRAEGWGSWFLAFAAVGRGSFFWTAPHAVCLPIR